MAELVNLRKFRKKKARAEKSAEAENNRIRFGRTKQEKQQATRETEASEKSLDGKKLD